MEHSDNYMDPFEKEEILSAIKCMPKETAADRHGILLKMLLFGGEEIIDILLSFKSLVVVRIK